MKNQRLTNILQCYYAMIHLMLNLLMKPNIQAFLEDLIKFGNIIVND